jgi:hypothetical protein
MLGRINKPQPGLSGETGLLDSNTIFRFDPVFSLFNLFPMKRKLVSHGNWNLRNPDKT